MQTTSQLGRSLWLATWISLALFFTACTNQEPPSPSLVEAEEALVMTDVAMEAEYADLETIASEGVDVAEGDYSYQTALVITNCVTLTRDTAQQLLTIDFGTGCVGPDGKTRAGRLLVSYDRRMWRPGALRIITPDSFYVDGVQVEGTLTYTNVTQTLQDPITIQAVLTNGKVTWPNGDIATRSYDRTFLWDRAANPSQDRLLVTGNGQATSRNGVAYTFTIDSDLIYRRACRYQGYRLPAEGVLIIQRSGHGDLTVDFGSGTCDHEVTLTKNGQSVTVVL
jgi:hypothetical protein